MWFGGPHTIWTWSRLSISSLYVQLDHHILVFLLYYLRWAPPFVVYIDEPIVRVQDGRTLPFGFEDTFLETLYIFIFFGQFSQLNKSLQPGFFVAKVVYIV